VATTKFVLAETGTRRHVIMMHFGNGDKAKNRLCYVHYVAVHDDYLLTKAISNHVWI